MILKLLGYFSILVLLPAAAWALLRYSRLQQPLAQSMAWYLGLKAVFEVVSVLSSLLYIKNIQLFYIYSLLEAWLLAQAFCRLSYLKAFVPFIRVSLWLLLPAIVLESIWVWGVHFNTYTRLAECILFCGLALIAFYKFTESAYLSASLGLPDFWFLLSVFFYMGGHGIIVFFINHAMSRLGETFSRHLWLFNYVSFSISNLLLIAGIWISSKPIKLAK